MDDLISRSALKETMFQNEPVERFHPQENKMWQECFGFIENAPAVDAVEVVRCKDCKHYMTIHCTCDGCCISDYWYCADGERRANDGK